MNRPPVAGGGPAELRPAAGGDTDALVELTRRTIDRCYRPFLRDAALARLMDRCELERTLSEGLPGCLVVAQDDAPRGFALCEDNVIRLLIIDHRCHRQGLGSRLLRNVETRLFVRQARLWLEGFEGNEHGSAFCARHGWRPVSRYPDETMGASRVVFEKDRAVPR